MLVAGMRKYNHRGIWRGNSRFGVRRIEIHWKLGGVSALDEVSGNLSALISSRRAREELCFQETKRSCTVWSCNYLSCTIFLFIFDPYLYGEKKGHLLIQPSFCHHPCALPVGSYSISFPNPMSYLVLPAGASLSILLPSHQIMLSHSM